MNAIDGLTSDLTRAEVASEISLMNSAIEAVTGKKPSILRYPVSSYPSINYSLAKETRRL
jgi:peptidoglycan/xylan/chitin deacetylase (PgdA/CDA1 family)